MNEERFLKALDLIKSELINQKIERSYNSIGSNIFLKFGKNIEFILSNGQKRLRNEWIIWISHASWRISKEKIFVVGSGVPSEFIQEDLDKLVDKKFLSFRILSQFFDMEFAFEDNYTLTTFFNWKEENQWTIFLPNDSSIRIDCSNNEAIKNVQTLARNFKIEESYTAVDLPFKDIIIKGIVFDENKLPTFICENDISITLIICMWRLEKDDEYYIGYIDGNGIKEKLSEIIGEKIERIDIANSMMDARFQIGKRYVLKTFSCCYFVNQWKVCHKNMPVFSANIQI